MLSCCWLPAPLAAQTSDFDEFERVFDRAVRVREEFAALQGDLPCLNSSTECVQQLQQLAIANSSELKLIEQRIVASRQRIDYQGSQRWTTWINPNPVALVQNILGGGDAQKVDLAIADLELKTSELEARKAEIASKLKDRVLTELLRFEELHDRSELQAAIAARETTRFKVIEVGYRLGEGSTAEMMSLMSQLDRVKAQAVTTKLERKAQALKIQRLVMGVNE
jgi:hypothetical protein